MCNTKGFHHVVFRNLFHLAFHHHDVFQGCSDQNVDIGIGEVGNVGINDKLAIDPGHADFRDRSEKRNVADSKGCRGSKACQRVRHDIFIGRDEGDDHLDFGMKIIGE